jgi:hypothetical protein
MLSSTVVIMPGGRDRMKGRRRDGEKKQNGGGGRDRVKGKGEEAGGETERGTEGKKKSERYRKRKSRGEEIEG